MNWLDKTRELLGESKEEVNMTAKELAVAKRIATGIAYEKKVRKAVASAQKKNKKDLSHLVLKRDGRGSVQDAHSNDLEFMYTTADGKKVPLYVEIKAGMKATFGTMSFRHTIGTKEFEPVGTYGEDFDEALNAIKDFLATKSKDIARKYNTLKKSAKDIHKEKIFRHNRLSFQLPKYIYVDMFNIPDGASDELKKEKTTFGRASMTGDGIAEHYNAKDVYYIQIKNKGLYYIGADVLKLGVPKFSPTLDLSVRFKPSGGKANSDGHPRVTLELVGDITPRADIDDSDVSLDKVGDYMKIFGRDVE